MFSLDPPYLDNIRLSNADANIIHEIGKFSGKQQLYNQQLPEILRTLRQHAIIESVESSNRIEGITAPQGKISALVLQNAMPENRSEQEIAGYRDALNLIHEVTADMPFSVNVIRQLHQTVHSYLPDGGGRWKMTDNDIVEKGAAGNILRVRFKTVPAVQTDIYMHALVERYQTALQQRLAPPLILLPLVILDYLCIHPFHDGNGRTARLLTLLLLYHFGYEVGRYISIERIFEESKEGYYETLHKSSQGWHDSRHDPSPWLRYFWGVLLRAYREYEERVGILKNGGGIKTALVREAVLRMDRDFTLNDLLLECPGISREWARRTLRDMKQAGTVILIGQGRGARWKKI